MSPSIYLNPSASRFSITVASSDNTDPTLIRSFHQQLPYFKPTPLVPLSELAKELGLESVLVKDESSRCGLPAFKILGASWAAFRAIATFTSLPLNTSLSALKAAAKSHDLALYTATDGNHGRAVARMAALLSIPAHIYVPSFTDDATRTKIASESPDVTVQGVSGDYDAAVSAAYADSESSERHLFIQDTSFPGYEEIPGWCIDGYSTLLHEIEKDNVIPTHIFTPLGVGSLASAVVNFAKSGNRKSSSVHVIAVEPENAACLHHSLVAGEPRTITTRTTIMDGMNCGNVSPAAWPLLSAGIDASLTITERQCHEALGYLAEHGINAGPCGAATLAGLRNLMADSKAVEALGLDGQSVVVLLCTEGKREYKVPE